MYGCVRATDITASCVVVLLPQLDTFSLYDGLAPGADSAATGIVALLAVAEALGQVKEQFTDTDRPIMLSFFHGVSPCFAAGADVLSLRLIYGAVVRV